MTPRVVYTTGEVAEALRCSPRAVRRWVQRGLLGGIRLPNRVLIPRRELVRFLVTAAAFDSDERSCSTQNL